MRTSNCKTILCFLFILTPILSFGQIEMKRLLKERNFIVDYFQNEEYLIVFIQTDYTPFIYSDINSNNYTDPYVDKLYTIVNGGTLCVANQLENGATSTCGQTTKAIVIADQNKYEFIIPRNELSYTAKVPIYLSFGALDRNSHEIHRFRNKNKSFVIEF